MKRWSGIFLAVFILFFPFVSSSVETGALQYEDFKTPKRCRTCHKAIYREWQQSLMSQSFTHYWDDVEYFKLALPLAMKLDKVADVKGGCIACHSPIAFLTGDIPPKPPAEGTRANEGVSCEICHSITGSTEKEPFNFSYIAQPGKVKFGPRGDGRSSFHDVRRSEFITSPELCATCHDEKSPYGAWVKETCREWKSGPYAAEGTRCQDCHMYHANGKSATGGKSRPDVAHHNFHGAHFSSKLAGAVDIALYSDTDRAARGSDIKITVELFNGKVGHYIPSGSSEERMLWLEMEALDAKGKRYPLTLDRKGFKGEEYTVSDPNALAYQAMGEILGVKDFKGVKRDGDIPDGVRIFRRPFIDPKQRMTICQWYTVENRLVDYRIGPRKTTIETYFWNIPNDISKGPITIKATLFYSLVPSSVGEFLQLPPLEYAPVKVNTAALDIEIINR